MLDRLQYPCCANDCRIKQIFLGICHIEVEGRRSVNNGVEGRIRLDSFVKCTWLGYVLDDGKIELVLGDVFVVV